MNTGEHEWMVPNGWGLWTIRPLPIWIWGSWVYPGALPRY